MGTTRNKLTAVLIVSFILLILIFLVYLILTKKSSNSSRSRQDTVSLEPTLVQATDILVQFSSVSPTPQLVAMGTKSFVIHIPKEWSAEQDGSASGESVLIKPSTSKEEIPEKSMRIVIERNVTASRINQLQKSYELRQYLSNKVTLLGYPATEYTGFSLAPAESGMVPLQESVYMIQRNKDVYLIMYHYYGSERNDTYDYEFESMISTLELK